MQFIDLESLLKLGIATVLGATVGLERGTHGRPAGLRTHALVCLASALLIIVSRTSALEDIQGTGRVVVNIDPSRMAAGIVTGIGFLGAGAILRIGGSLIRGLTTAACVWFVAAIGVAVGVGAYGIAVPATIIALIILTLFDRFEDAMGSVSYHTLVIEVDNLNVPEVEQQCRDLLKARAMRIQEVSYFLDKHEKHTKLSFSVRMSVKADKKGLISDVAALKGVATVTWS